MLVEFVGAAGVGKSFLAQRLYDTLRGQRLLVHKFDRIPIKRADLKTLLTVLAAIDLSRSTRPKTLSAYLTNLNIIGRYYIRRKLSEGIEGVHISNDGLFHRIIGMSRRSKGLRVDQIALRLFRTIQPPDIVVVVEAEAETIYTRRVLRNRLNDVFSGESVRVDIASVEESVGAIVEVQRMFKSQMQLLRVDASVLDGNLASSEIVRLVQSTNVPARKSSAEQGSEAPGVGDRDSCGS